MATKDSKQLRSERTNLEKKIQELQTKYVNIEEEKYDAVAKVRDSMQLIEEANLQKSQVINLLYMFMGQLCFVELKVNLFSIKHK